MLIDNEDYPIENPKYYLVVLAEDGNDIKELIFTRENILNYLDETKANPTNSGV